MTITPADSLDALIARGPPDAADFAKQIAGLPGAYYAGLDEAYKRRTQDAFQGGYPTIDVKGANGNIVKVPDYGAMTDTTLRAGGIPSIPAAVSLSNLDLARQKLIYGQTINEQVNPPVVPGAPPSMAPATLPPPPRISSDGTGQSITGLVSPTEFGQQTNRVAAAVANKFKVDQTQQLSPQQVSDIQEYVAQIPRPPQQPAQPAVAQAPQAVPSSTPNVIPSAGGGPNPGGRTDIQQLTIINRALGSGMLEPDQAKSLQAQAESIYKRMELTPGGKDYRDYVEQSLKSGQMPLGRDQWEAQTKFEQGRAGKQGEIYATMGKEITTAGMQSTLEIPKLAFAKSLMADPNFYSGPLEKQNETYKSILASIDPAHANDALPQQAFKKVISDSLTSSIKGLAQSGAGRVQLAEIRIMERAAANMANTPAANRLLVEIATRAHQLNVDIADLASKYNGGNLDPRFDAIALNYAKQHPVVRPDELKDPEKVAPPIFKTPQEALAKGFANKWIETPDGRKIYLQKMP